MSDVVIEHDIHVFDSILRRLPEKTQILLKTLPLLDGVTVQLLRFLSANSLRTILAIISDASPKAFPLEQDLYHSLLALFIKLVSLYNTKPQLLRVSHIFPGVWHDHHPSPSFIQTHERYILLVLRKVNICLFLLTLLKELPFGISFLADNFIEVFCFNVDSSKVEDLITANRSRIVYGRLLKPQTVLYLDLMTQYYISALVSSSTPHTSKSPLLDQVFPDTILDDIKDKTIKYAGKYMQLQIQCTETDFKERCKRRKTAILECPDLQKLMKKYDWEECCKEVFSYGIKRADVLLYGRRGKGLSSVPSRTPTPVETIPAPVQSETLPVEEGESDLVEELPNTINTTEAEVDVKSTVLRTNEPQRRIDLPVKPFKTKPKQKKMWTQEEEDCLKSGLKQCGPAWAKILSLYGPGGTVSESLKNRSQVQLKDKARNWKMHYLKNMKPVPEYLEKVTGDLERGLKSKKKPKSKPKPAV
ncbi:Tbf1p [Kluyveromyces lactis]|uniref:KLLA0D06765p n=1 Tax=Kluyveromyces lactis (strain ATCC 8585 / CBS 2359 / DSM 70799 / NBRC 1267 / NRRL Y-1140 / WM37) TaxID=284590 RepID=Q6CRS7_KLULA|nr:uncharacterized protein KLLA0_D06765g [Kluyveromyces lactis]CAH00458.1 KLLA0D06765p [Kluyveromyces lactis]|eukprot:XP_453362.1 uncharacterized protein KLLA0_D06765g [Kluyveromyces lactis]